MKNGYSPRGAAHTISEIAANINGNDDDKVAV